MFPLAETKYFAAVLLSVVDRVMAVITAQLSSWLTTPQMQPDSCADTIDRFRRAVMHESSTGRVDVTTSLLRGGRS